MVIPMVPIPLSKTVSGCGDSSDCVDIAVARDGLSIRASHCLVQRADRTGDELLYAARRVAPWCGVLLWVCCGFVAGAARAENPRVEAAIDQALAFLNKSDDGRLGGKALIGLTFSKHGEPATHPKIAAAIRDIQAALEAGPERFTAGVYDTGVCLMLLVSVDPSRYRFEIEGLVRSLHLRQKSDGAWGYPLENPDHGKTCDTSMTQYAVLGLWEAEDQAGVETPRVVWERVARWLLLTQDPNGGYGYQGKVSPRLGRWENQEGVRDSMTVAAVGSLYIVKDRVGMTQLKKPLLDDTPEAMHPFEAPEERQERLKTSLSPKHFGKAIANGNRWIENEVDVENITGYTHYCLYALERFESLREADLSNRELPEEKSERSKWYNRGVRYLLRTQKSDGSWESQCGVVPDTCFGALFLMGSTRKSLARSSLARFHADTLIGGQGFPADHAVRLRDGQVVVQPLPGSLEEILKTVVDTTHPQRARAIEALADAAEREAPESLVAQAKVLRRLARQAEPEVRRLAILCLGRSASVDECPGLIQLLSDPDVDIALAAATALAQISRKFETLGFDRQATPRQKDEAIRLWKAWFHSLRPDLDVDLMDVDLVDEKRIDEKRIDEKRIDEERPGADKGP